MMCLKQGNSFFPLLFIIIVEVLNKLIIRVRKKMVDSGVGYGQRRAGGVMESFFKDLVIGRLT